MNEKLEEMAESCGLEAPSKSEDRNKDPESTWDIFPNDIAPVLIVKNDRIAAVPMRWGFKRNDSRLVVNARAENAAERIMFQRLTNRNRCAIPAAGYYEWHDGDRRKYLITPSDAEGLYLAGLYKKDETGELRFVVLTRSAYGKHTDIHGRMPGLFTAGPQVRRWLGGEISLETVANSETEALVIHPMGCEQMRMQFQG